MRTRWTGSRLSLGPGVIEWFLCGQVMVAIEAQQAPTMGDMFYSLRHLGSNGDPCGAGLA